MAQHRRFRVPIVPDVDPTSVRFDDATRAAIREECERQGLKTMAEYVRKATLSQLAWDRAVRLVQAGIQPGELAGTSRLIQLLTRVAAEGTTESPDAKAEGEEGP